MLGIIMEEIYEINNNNLDRFNDHIVDLVTHINQIGYYHNDLRYEADNANNIGFDRNGIVKFYDLSSWFDTDTGRDTDFLKDIAD